MKRNIFIRYEWYSVIETAAVHVYYQIWDVCHRHCSLQVYQYNMICFTLWHLSQIMFRPTRMYHF